MKTDKNSRIHTTSGAPSQPEQAFPDTKHTDTTPAEMQRISYNQWLTKYRPIKNPLTSDAPFEGCMFETFGVELAFIQQQPELKIWTLIDCGERKLFICEGFHFVDRLGYFVTEMPFPSNHIFCVKAD